MLRLIQKCAEFISQEGVGDLKKRLRAHFSVFEVWGNIADEEVAELEGMFRHIYRHDRRANTLNVQRGFKALRRLRNNRIEDWPMPPKRGGT